MYFGITWEGCYGYRIPGPHQRFWVHRSQMEVLAFAFFQGLLRIMWSTNYTFRNTSRLLVWWSGRLPEGGSLPWGSQCFQVKSWKHSACSLVQGCHIAADSHTCLQPSPNVHQVFSSWKTLIPSSWSWSSLPVTHAFVSSPQLESVDTVGPLMPCISYHTFDNELWPLMCFCTKSWLLCVC